MRRLTLQPDGCYHDDSGTCFPVGVNYVVSADATRAELEADLRGMAAAGLNAVRVRSRPECARLAEIGVEELALVCEADEIISPAATNLRFIASPAEQLLGFDGLGDPFFHTFLPAHVRCARKCGPVVVAALGCGGLLGAAREEAWLRSSLPATRAAGAAGIFWNAWRGADGLVANDGNLHPGRRFFGELARDNATPMDAPSESEAIGIWLHGGSRHDAAYARLLLAQYFVVRLGRAWLPIGRNDLAEARCRTLLIAGGDVAPDVAGALNAFVTRGGELIWHGPDFAGSAGWLAPLLGARLTDWRSGRGVSVNAFGERFTMAHFPRDVRAEIEPVGATVLATDQQDLPLLLEHRLGSGRVRYVLPVVEDAILPVAAHSSARDRWLSWYRGMLGDQAR